MRRGEPKKRQEPRRSKSFGNESQVESSAVADDEKWRRRESNGANEIPISLDDNDLHAEPTAVVALGYRASDITSQCLSSNDMNDSPDDLQFVINSWQRLSLEVRQVICSIVEAAVVQ